MSGKKIWLNSKYIKTKQYQKLKNMFFGHFQVLYLESKQVYKLELLAKYIIHDVFYLSILRQDIPRKEQVNKVDKLLKLEQEINTRNNKKYKEEAICYSKVYTKEIVR